MRMIPSPGPEKATNSERRVYDLLHQARPERAVVLTSLHLSEHEYKKWGEIDFVVVSTQGLLALEVKGGQVHCEHGTWLYKSLRRQTVERSESPMAQAASAYFSLRTFLNGKLGANIEAEAVNGHAVILAHTSLEDAKSRGLLGGTEMPEALVGTSEDVRSVEALEKLLERIYGYWRMKPRCRRLAWKESRVDDIVRALRPEFDRIIPLSFTLQSVRDEHLALTEAQYQVLDGLRPNPRLTVVGGAGCGKTLLAMECLRREAPSNPLLVTGTESLAQHLRKSYDTNASRVISYRELSQMHEQSRPSTQCLIVDEGQQITDSQSILVLSSLLEGGIEGGRWRWFTDPNHQVTASGRVDPAQHAWLLSHSAQFTLQKNCRNTPQIAATVQLFTGALIGDATTSGCGPAVEIPGGAPSDQIAAAAGFVKEWLKDRTIPPGDIMLLSAKALSEWSIPALARQVGRPWKLWTPGWERHPDRQFNLAASTVENFRGIESPFVVLCDVDDSLDSPVTDLYLGMTRANFGLVVISTPEVLRRTVEFSNPPTGD